MKTLRLTSVFAWATLAAAFLPAQDATDLDSKIGAKIDAAMAKGMKHGKVPGASLLVAQGEKVLFEKGYGFADLEHGVPVTPETVFRIGSITKQFTAAAIMKLRDAGKLKITSEFAALTPKFGFPGKPVTVHQLLNHTSGIKSFTGLRSYRKDVQLFDKTPEQMFALIKDVPFDFEPGAKMLYNNSGYYLLGVIIEKLSGKTYEQYLADEFFAPLGMTQSRYGGATPIVKHRARGYSEKDGEIVNAAWTSMRPPFAAGALLSTTRDLHKWNVALHGGKVVSAESYKMMITPREPAILGKGGYGYGLMVRYLGRHQAIQHGGGINGFSTMLAYYPEQKLSIVLLFNRDQNGPGPLATELGILVLRELAKR